MKCYLCCIFAPSKSFFREDMDFYASNSQWIPADTGVNAVRMYKSRINDNFSPEAQAYTRVLDEGPLGSHRDGERGYVRALRVMMEYYTYDRYTDLATQDLTRASRCGIMELGI